MQQLNLQLPVRDVRSEYTQREIQMTRDRGHCNSSPPPYLAEECAPVYGVEDELQEVILWRNADLVAEYLFAHGASKIVSENVSGHAGEDGVFRYRALVVSYETEALAESSPIWDMVDACPQASGTARRALSEAGDAYLVATTRDTRIILVETWTGTYEGKAGRITDTSSGRLPTSAVDTIIEWMDQSTSLGQAVQS
jgi:hypothetical protein